MPDEDFDDRLERINQIADAVEKFDNPVLQEAAYHYLVGDVAPGRDDASHRASNRRATPRTPTEDVKDLDDTASEKGPGKQGRKSSPKKQTIEFDKSLDLYASTGPSKLGFPDFVAAHTPKNV